MINVQNLVLVHQKGRAYWYQLLPTFKKWLFRFSFLFLLFLLVSNQEISFHIHIGSHNSSHTPSLPTSSAIQASILPTPTKWWKKVQANKNNIKQKLNLANAATATGAALTPAQQKLAANYSNLGFVLNPTYAQKKSIDPKIVAYKVQKCQDYIQLYVATAQEEANLFGIPASITLAQALLESNVGDSQLAINENNHFGIKCKSKCQGCRCANYTDDSKYDMFRIFDSPWYSFREHSNLLAGARYKHLLELPKNDYKNWAHGLQAAGYATDQQYGKKLIQIIEALHLYQYDRAQ
jgi:flagellum-specific peptidoglycan hydrolase FlgJ